MSFILDALKKAEQERQGDQIPNIKTIHGSAPASGTRNRFSRRTIIALVFSICFLFAGYFLYSSSLFHGKGLVETIIPDSGKEPEKVASNRTAEETVVDQASVGQESNQVMERQKGSTVEAKSTLSDTTIADDASGKSQENIGTQPFLRKDLPEAILVALPELDYAGHAYSEIPKKRMIIINNRIHREGDLVQPGLRLEEITLYGVLLNYNGVMFYDYPEGKSHGQN